MSLPDDYDYALDAFDPFPSALAMRLQTAVIAHAHRSLPMYLGSDMFIADGAKGLSSQLGWLSVNAAAIARATIRAMAGTIIDSVTVSYNRNGAGSMQPKLRRMNFLTGVITTIWTGTDDNTGSTIEQQSNSPAHVMLDTDVYWVECSFTDAANRLYGAKLMLSRPM